MQKRKTDLVVTGYIFNDQKEVLLIHHKKLNIWLPVGGHIEKDETPDEALLREIKEETGLNIQILNQSEVSIGGNTKQNLATPFHVNIHSVGDHDHCSFFYICKTKEEISSINKNELNNFKWFSERELHQDLIPEDVRNIAIKAFELFFAQHNFS